MRAVHDVNFVQSVRKQWHKSFLIDFHRANGFFVVIGKFVILVESGGRWTLAPPPTGPIAGAKLISVICPE